MKNKILLFLFSLGYICNYAQVTCSATASSGSGYTVITNSGFGIENPDCEHVSFGPHITQIYDTELERNVFIFHSHIIEDNDRCINFDRVRMEIKGGPNTLPELQHPKNSASYYRWKFRLGENFIGSSSFCHIFQNKAKGGTDSGFPILTITARANILEFKHNGGDNGTALGILAQADLSLFKGKWVEGYLRQFHSETGEVELTLKDMETGNILLAYSNDNIDLWRSGSTYNRPKWGIYRKKSDGLQDEKIRFADFCVSEIDSSLCPAEAGMIVSNISEENIFSDEFYIYPNPANENMRIVLGGNKKGTATIFSINGKQIGSALNVSTEINKNISALNKGIYILAVQLQNGKAVYRKFIVN